MRTIFFSKSLRGLSALLCIAVAMLFMAPKAFAAPGPGTAAVQKANTSIKALLGQKVAAGSQAEKDLAVKITTEVRSLLDVDELGRAALKSHWDKISAAEQKEYLDLLRSLIEAEYVKGLRSNVQYTVNYKGESAGKGSDIVVATEIAATRKGRPLTIKVDYVLGKSSGKLRAYDIKTDGVSMIDNYRAQFDKLISKGGMENLLGKMRKKAGK